VKVFEFVDLMNLCWKWLCWTT